MAATALSSTSIDTPVPLLRPEILAPAGDWECAQAAVENGADAIYFGLERFNARMRAQNFTAADLPRLMEYLHRRGVRGYVTFNTLVFADELVEAEAYLRTIIAAGVDAAIVQDVGICRLIRALSPDFPIHCSTQMTITSAAGIAFAEELGANLVVLARENSLTDIAAIQAAQGARRREPPVTPQPSANDRHPPSSVPRQSPLVHAPASVDTDLSSIVNRSLSFDSGSSALDPRPSTPLPLEVFVHGALCVAYSGQCLTSEALGGRSANRGECAQACRLPYDLLADGKLVDLGHRRYLLSPQDLAAIDVVPDLIRLGVASFKIEGRLKSPEYVAAITRVYRQAVDRVIAENSARVAAGLAAAGPAFAGATADRPGPAAPATSFLLSGAEPPLRLGLHGSGPDSAAERRQTEATVLAALHREHDYTMEMTFSRGLYSGWFRGTNNQELVHANFGTKRGVFLGEVSRVGSDFVALRLVAPLKPGDGIVFDAGCPEEKEEGGRVYQVEPRDAETLLRFGTGDLDFRRIHAGDRLWKTSDPALEKRIRQTFQGEQIRFTRPIRIEVHGSAGTPLTVTADDRVGHAVMVESAIPLEPSRTQPLTDDRLREQLGRLGGTPFSLDRFASFVEGNVMLPISELNRLRRVMVAELEELRARPPHWTLTATPAEAKMENLPIVGGKSGMGDLPAVSSSVLSAIASATAEALAKEEAFGEGWVLPMSGGLTQTHGQDARATADIQPAPAGPRAAELIVLVRTLEQLDAAWSAGARTIYCEFEDPKRYREAVRRFRELQAAQGPEPFRQAQGPECVEGRSLGTGDLVAEPRPAPTARDAAPLRSASPFRPMEDGSRASSLLQLHESAQRLQHGSPPSTIWVAPPRVFKPGEEWILDQVLSSGADGYLARNYDHLAFFRGRRMRGDYPLNIANPLSAAYFLQRYGLERVTASYDLNAAQLEALLQTAPPAWFEITTHQHMPLFHMEHCIACAFLTSGRDYHDCCRPCDRLDLRLRDRVGAELPVKADAGCRNTVFNNRAQTGAEYLDRLLALGARAFRVEFLNETPDELRRTVHAYQQLVRGEATGAELWREFKLINQLGVTRGQMEGAAPVIRRKHDDY
jgi:putative protease